MKNLEIKYTTNKKELPLTIDFNFDEIKTSLVENLDKYQNLLVTENTIQEGKKTKAELNKLKKALDQERKNKKKECLQPYNDFELKIKELIALIDEPVNIIDMQIKNFDEQKREEKKQLCINLYNTLIGDLNGIIPFDRIFKIQWLNATTSQKTIKEEIELLINKVNTDLLVIDGLHSEFHLELLDLYNETLDLQKIIIKNNSLYELKRAQEEEIEAKAQKALVVQEETVENITIEEPSQPITKEKRLSVIVTAEQLELLNDFLITNNIKFKEL